MTSSDQTTVVHLLRHGEVYNPDGILYGRLPDYHLSDIGRQMAERVADDACKDRDITHLVASPLERAQETAQPSAEALGLDIVTDERVIEAANTVRGPGVRRRRRIAAQAVDVEAPLQPVQAVVGRALQGHRGPDARGDARCPRGGGRP